MIQLSVNQKSYSLDIDPNMPLLWAIRDVIGLTGTKYSCGISLCGACTVHMDGSAIRSCVTPVSQAEGKNITTIEGINSTISNAVQQAWEKLNVVQCGYCQSGQIMAAVDLLSKTPHPNDENINEAMSGNICRCHTYYRIRAAIKEAAKSIA